MFRDPRPILDPNGHIFAVLAGMPADPTYKASATSVFEEFKAAGQMERFNAKERSHHRGHFPTVMFGISSGNGQPAPARLKTGCHGELVGMLLESAGLSRIANYQDCELVTTRVVNHLTHLLIFSCISTLVTYHVFLLPPLLACCRREDGRIP